jgi:hypothetical protein
MKKSPAKKTVMRAENQEQGRARGAFDLCHNVSGSSRICGEQLLFADVIPGRCAASNYGAQLRS